MTNSRMSFLARICLVTITTNPVACGDDGGDSTNTDTTTSGTETAGTLEGSSSAGTSTNGTSSDTSSGVEADSSSGTAYEDEMLSEGSTGSSTDAASSSGGEASDSTGTPADDESSTGATEPVGSSDSSSGGGDESGDASTGSGDPSVEALCGAACAQAASAGCDGFDEDACLERCFAEESIYIYYLMCYEEFRAARECEAMMEYTCPGTMDPGTCAAEQQALLGCG